MNRFKIRITDDEENIHVYTDVSKIDILDNKIKIVREDGSEHKTHRLDRVDEMHIKADR